MTGWEWESCKMRTAGLAVIVNFLDICQQQRNKDNRAYYGRAYCFS
jgi:hypothetical protein